MYILENFKKDVKILHMTEEEFDEIFSRKLKNIMMTHGCSMKRPTRWRYSLEKIDFFNYSYEKQSKITTFFNSFYTFLNTNSAILKKSPNKLVNYFDKDKKVNFIDKSNANLTYYQRIKTQKEFKFNKVR